MKTKRLLALLMAICILLTLTACGKGKGKESGKAGEFEIVDAYANDEVVDLDGYEFTIASNMLGNDLKNSEAGRIFAKRIEEVEKAYNCTITIKPYKNVVTQILAGEKVADWVDMDVSGSYEGIAGKYLRPYDTIEGIDVKDSRWNSGYVNLSKYDGLSYGVNFLKPAEVRIGVFFNKTLLKQNGITENLYDLVRNKQWSFDKLREYAKKCTKDTDGDGKNDVYGILFYDEEIPAISFVNSNGTKVVDVGDGKVTEHFKDSKTLDAMNYLNNLCNVDKSVYVNDTWRSASTHGSLTLSQTDRARMFVNNQVAFYIGETWVCNQLIKPMNTKIEYGFLPIPLGPDGKEYVSVSHYARNLFVTVTNRDLDKAVPVMNALALPPEGYEGSDWWEEILMSDYFQDGDTDSLEMYKLCLDNMVFDYVATSGADLYTNFAFECFVKPVYYLEGTVSSALGSMSGQATDRVGALFGFEK